MKIVHVTHVIRVVVASLFLLYHLLRWRRRRLGSNHLNQLPAPPRNANVATVTTPTPTASPNPNSPRSMSSSRRASHSVLPVAPTRRRPSPSSARSNEGCFSLLWREARACSLRDPLVCVPSHIYGRGRHVDGCCGHRHRKIIAIESNHINAETQVRQQTGLCCCHCKYRHGRLQHWR